VRDDQDTKTISWPNYHAGRNGDYQRVTPVEPIHQMLLNPDNAISLIEYFPAHPHDGGIGVPRGVDHASVIAAGVRWATHGAFNLIVAFERGTISTETHLAVTIAESSFHHFVDNNRDISEGCASFLEELPGAQIRREPEKLAGGKTYVRNLAVGL
jgi:hypothetical protein